MGDALDVEVLEAVEDLAEVDPQHALRQRAAATDPLEGGGTDLNPKDQHPDPPSWQHNTGRILRRELGQGTWHCVAHLLVRVKAIFGDKHVMQFFTPFIGGKLH